MISKFILVAVIGYLLGSIPFGVIIGKRVAKVDVTRYGSGKMGTTNVLRTVGKKAAAAVFVLDLIKGTLSVVFAGLIIGQGYLVVNGVALGMLAAQIIAASMAMLGHHKSVFLRFQGGGRSVATFFGEVFIIGTGTTKFVSLGSIIAVVSTYAVLIPLTVLNKAPIEYLIYTLVGTVAILIIHRDNIRRLMAGKERKLGEKVKIIK